MQIVSIETICMKCQILFSGKIKKIITILPSALSAERVVMVNLVSLVWDKTLYLAASENH